jgi:hypothetical protein
VLLNRTATLEKKKENMNASIPFIGKGAGGPTRTWSWIAAFFPVIPRLLSRYYLRRPLDSCIVCLTSACKGRVSCPFWVIPALPGIGGRLRMRQHTCHQSDQPMVLATVNTRWLAHCLTAACRSLYRESLNAAKIESASRLSSHVTDGWATHPAGRSFRADLALGDR